jgi:hypothetical protein
MDLTPSQLKEQPQRDTTLLSPGGSSETTNATMTKELNPLPPKEPPQSASLENEVVESSGDRETVLVSPGGSSETMNATLKDLTPPWFKEPPQRDSLGMDERGSSDDHDIATSQRPISSVSDNGGNRTSSIESPRWSSASPLAGTVDDKHQECKAAGSATGEVASSEGQSIAPNTNESSDPIIEAYQRLGKSDQ